MYFLPCRSNCKLDPHGMYLMNDIKMILKALFFVVFLLNPAHCFASPLSSYLGVTETSGQIDGANSENRAQFRIGGLFEIPITSHLFLLKTGLGISQRGSKVSHALYSITEDRTFLDVPLLAVYENPLFQIYGGALLATRLGSKCSISDPSLTCTNSATQWLVAQPILGFNSPEFNAFRLGLFYELPVEYQKNWNQESIGVLISLEI